jgi:prolyl-tRNA editing enzyme YbaK/EbsC (Cys-tRNA(Pro) deacylase)
LSDVGSVARVRAALLAAGHADTVTAVPASAHTAADAATAIGCDVAQIAKTIVFRSGDQAMIVVASGAVRVDLARAAAAFDVPLSRANASFVREHTGFAIGGVSPVALPVGCRVILDQSLAALNPVWAAAGSPSHVFSTTPDWLTRLTGAVFADVAER